MEIWNKEVELIRIQSSKNENSLRETEADAEMGRLLSR